MAIQRVKTILLSVKVQNKYLYNKSRNTQDLLDAKNREKIDLLFMTAHTHKPTSALLLFSTDQPIYSTYTMVVLHKTQTTCYRIKKEL